MKLKGEGIKRENEHQKTVKKTIEWKGQRGGNCEKKDTKEEKKIITKMNVR